MRLEVGQKAVFQRRLAQEDFNRFALLSGDDNPIHTDPDFAARTRFGKPVAHGAFLFGLISSALGTLLPGPGTLILYQELMFPTPTYAGEEVTVQVEVTSIDSEKNQAELATLIIRPNGEIGCQGLAVVHFGPSKGWPRVERETPPSPPSESDFLKGFRLGEKACLQRAFASGDIRTYIELTGDSNPIYTESEWAFKKGLNRPLLPAPLLGALFSCLLGVHLPGWGTNYLKQRFLFLEPAYPDEELKAKVEIVRLRPEKELINLRTTCLNSDGKVICDGEALVLVRDVRAKEA
ncbi:MAG: MaoC/PaaZ C-terminal domain-containing protein [Anaerolineae bacterium]|nr:MaoC/PaaZ C-terminal domain-containing protein [Anaerolineae bacterium]MDW8101912.1 MaoC/PaaZ C-terminal domain-containing protein [Anaerolineae bacterium]